MLGARDLSASAEHVRDLREVDTVTQTRSSSRASEQQRTDVATPSSVPIAPIPVRSTCVRFVQACRGTAGHTDQRSPVREAVPDRWERQFIEVISVVDALREEGTSTQMHTEGPFHYEAPGVTPLQRDSAAVHGTETAHRGTAASPPGYKGNRRTLIVDIVEFVLRRCQSNNIQNFHFRTYCHFQKSDASRLIELICFAVDRNVCSLTLKIGIVEERPLIKLPQNILTCKSLVKLNIDCSDFVLDIPDCTVCFSCLKFLSIYIYPQNSNSLQKLFRSCPILEELKIKGWNDTDGNELTFDINVPTLKKLKIHIWFYWSGEILVYRFVVRASNLEYLELYNGYLACVLVGETPFLNKVILGGFIEPDEDEATMRATEFFKAISSTRFLSLFIIDMSVLFPPLHGNLPLFPNLIHLKLEIDFFDGLELLVQFFNNSPILEVLDLTQEYFSGWREVVRFELESVPFCMLFHLKEVRLYLVDSDGQDLDVIKCLLENSKVLERISVRFCLDKHKQEIQNEILNFPRASPICEIEFAA
ncbi:hypothetical protein LWI29_013223 [Acer saccharum]|uniref:FBD domain-containing protein n=1 Tax=Acer saccharum TaxID=4024 RepID=A0AA39RRU5_ACESA|nr:hypothetical protein LWI29_013223 [Acer saccharum]